MTITHPPPPPPHQDVDETWNWEKTLTVTIFHSAYKAIPTLGERRAAFLRYQAELSRVTKTKREERVALRRDAFLRVLSEYPSINVYSVWPKYADELKGRVELEGYAPKELQTFFREYITLLQTHKREEEARIRAENLEKFSTLLQSLPFAPDTTWAEAQASIQDTPLYQADEQLREGDPQAYVDAFDAHMDRLVEEDSARSRAEAEGIAVRAAEAREAFKALLHRLREAGEIGAATRWQDAYPLVAPHPAYRAMLESTAVAGGSSPQELLWDVVEDAYEPIYRRRKEIERYFKLRAYKPREDMTFDEFTAQLDPAVHFLGLSRRDMEMVHEEVQQKARFKARDERERAERAQKRRVNHLWATLADLRPPLLPNASWEAEYERIKDTDAVRDFPVVEECREAFEAYVSSMKD
jgi:pre-mRNA-processing factor 40